MPYIILIVLLLALLFAPGWWARWTFRRYSKPLSRIAGTGGELARHLLDRFDMQEVQVEKTANGQDHYDPESRTVRLGADNHDTASITAIAVAAHEVGHAIQHHRGETMLQLRSRLVMLVQQFQKVSAGVMLIIPVVGILTHSPRLSLLFFVIGLASMLTATVIHLVTLPVEWDASFNKALPILKQGNYIARKDEVAVQRILKAAALTYLAASLASLLNLARWISVLRR